MAFLIGRFDPRPLPRITLTKPARINVGGRTYTINTWTEN